MPRPKVDAQWEEIRNAYLLGESSSSLASRFKVNPSTLRSRAKRENWTTPRNVSKQLQQRNTQIRAQKLRGDITKEEADRALAAIDETGRSIVEQQDAHKAAVAAMMRKQITKAKLPVIKSYKDLEVADRVMRRTLDMDVDRQDTIINVGILGNSGAIIDDDEQSIDV